jgi:salicylate hydroxylase
MAGLGIVGGGIGGLTLALGARESGLDQITVYERQPTLPESTGHGIQLTPNATRILHALGLREELADLACASDLLNYRSHRTGYQIAMRPLGAFAEARYGAPFCQVLRDDLVTLLTERVGRQGITLRRGWRCTAVTATDEAVDVRFADQETQQHALLVGCDGVHSFVRSEMHAEAPPAYTGHTAWRGVAPAACLPSGFNAKPVTVWIGPGRHLSQFPVRDGGLIAFTAVVETPYAGPESWYEPAERSDLAAAFAGWNPVVQALIEGARHLHSWPLYDRAPLARWTDGRVTLLGDACHPTLPYLAQGAALAMEDAWVLARMLENWEDEVPTALAEYERYRRPRAARAQVRAREEAQLLHVSNPRRMLWRNLRMALSSRYLPEIAMQRYDWLYGYDCVKGFH